MINTLCVQFHTKYTLQNIQHRNVCKWQVHTNGHCLPVPCTAIQEVAGMKSDQCIFYTIVQVAIAHSFQIEHTMLTRFHAKLRLQNQSQIPYCKRQMHKGLGAYNSSTSFIWLRCFGNKVGQGIVSEAFQKHHIPFIVRGTLPTSDYCQNVATSRSEPVAEVAVGPSVTQLFTCNVVLHNCSHVMQCCTIVHM